MTIIVKYFVMRALASSRGARGNDVAD